MTKKFENTRKKMCRVGIGTMKVLLLAGRVRTMARVPWVSIKANPGLVTFGNKDNFPLGTVKA